MAVPNEPAARHPRRRRRPLGVVILVVLELITAALILTALLFGGQVELPRVSTESDPEFAAIVAAIDLVLAFGLWRLQRWAWTGVMIWRGLVFLSLDLIAYAQGESPYVELLFSIVIVFYLNQSEVQRAFLRPHTPER